MGIEESQAAGGPPWIGAEVTGHGVRASIIHRPSTVAEVQRLVLDARRRKVALYPVSTGRNWGYGSAAPVRPDCELVELSGMNRIHGLDDLSIRRPVIRIEPGVTQGQLHETLRQAHRDLTFNVTGSAASSSLLGNALDRGVGYLGSRSEDIFGLEVVLGTGEILHTGARWLGESSPLSDVARDVHGPSLDGLFLQGNFGIVVGAGFRLRPRAPCERAVAIGLRHGGSLAELVDRIGLLKRAGVLPYVIHLANRARSLATLQAGMLRYLKMNPSQRPAGVDAAAAERTLRRLVKGEWTGLTVVQGSRVQVRESIAAARGALNGLATVDEWSAERLDRLAAIAHHLRRFAPLRALAAAARAARPLTALALGQPTDEPVRGLWPSDVDVSPGSLDPDRSPVGLLYVAPLLPLDGVQVADVLDTLSSIARTHGFDLPVTLNFDAPTSLLAITNLAFDRRDASQVSAAHDCARALEDAVDRLGLAVYRARADALREPTFATRGDLARRAHWAQLARLKAAFDPDGVIAPGRYVPRVSPDEDSGGVAGWPIT